MNKPHFVEAYEGMVARLIAERPLEEAMSLAVGGAYEMVGQGEADILQSFGLHNGMSIVDLGCGSGRLAHALGKRFHLSYIGIDIVQELLDFAKSKSPPHYHYILNHTLTIPVPDAWADFAAAFSVFTHLLPSESYLYLEDMKRVLRPGGRFVFSFLEFAEPSHWIAFADDFNRRRCDAPGHVNMMIERSVVELWCRRLGFELETIVGASDAPSRPAGDPAPGLGQTVAVFRKPG